MTALDPEGHPLRAALAELAEVKGDGADCFPASAIWDSAAERLGPAENRALIRHLGECPACGLAWELARDLAPASEPAAVASYRPRRVWFPLAAAAAAVLSVAVTSLWIYSSWTPEAPAPIFREEPSAWLVSEVPENVPLPRDACLLRWAAGPEGTTYDLRVTGEKLEPLARASRLDRPEYRIEPAALEPLPPGGKLLWRVTAHLPGGRQVVSLTFINRVE